MGKHSRHREVMQKIYFQPVIWLIGGTHRSPMGLGAGEPKRASLQEPEKKGRDMCFGLTSVCLHVDEQKLYFVCDG